MIIIPEIASCGTKGSMPSLYIETFGVTLAFYILPEHAEAGTESSGEYFNTEVTQNLVTFPALEFTTPNDGVVTGEILWLYSSLPSIEADGDGIVMGMGTGESDLPSLRMSGSSVPGFSGTGSAELPRLKISGNNTDLTGDGRAAIPVPEFSALGIHGVILEGDIQIRSPSMQGQIISEAEGGGASQARFRSLSAAGILAYGQIVSSALELPSLVLNSTFAAEQPGYGSPFLPALILEGTTAENGQGSGAATFSALILDGIIEGVLADIGVFVGAMNLRFAAVSDYEQWPFNSYAAVGSYGLGAKEDGIYEFVGDKDGALEMFSEFRKTHIDLSAFNHKRMTDAYFHIQSNGGYKIEIFADEVSSIHDVDDPGGGIHAWKVNLPRGIKGQGIGIGAKFFNTDFILDEVAMVSEFTSRRNR